MKKSPTFEELVGGLARGIIVPLDEKKWDLLAPRFQVVDRIDTGLSGRILLIRWPQEGKRKKGWAIVEDPEPQLKVVRPLKDEKEARALIADRLAAYERMWDG